MQSKRKLSLYIVAGLLAVLVSLIGLALSKSIVVNPVSNRLGINGIYRDGWTEAKSSIDLSKLSSVADKVHLVFESWRPESAHDALLLVKLCGKQVAELQVTRELSDFWVQIPDECKTGLLEMEVKNPFKSATRDSMGIQFIEADFRYNPINAIEFDHNVLISSLVLFLILFAIYRLKPHAIVEALLIFSALVLAAISLPFVSWDNQFQLLFLGCGLFLALSGAALTDKARVETAYSNPLIVLVLISLAGAALRFYQIDFGLPYRYHPDEPRKAGIALKMVMTGNLDPNYFLHPSLLLYSTALLTKFAYTFGFISQLDDVSANLCGRMVSAIAGSLSIPLLFLMTKELFSSRIAMLSAAIFALSPLAITCSRYLKEDSLLLFFVLLTAWLAFSACNRNSFKLLLLAGLSAGFAAGSKYSGVLAFAAVAATPWIKSRSLIPDFKQISWVLLAALLIPVGFLITTPYAYFNFSKFYSNFEAEKGHMLTGHHKVVISSWSQYWMYHFSRSLPQAVSWPVLLAGIVAIGALIRGFKINLLVILGLFLVFYLPAESVNAKPPPQPERYIFPCLPFIAVLAAYFWHLVTDRSKLLGLLLIAILIISPAYRSIGLASEMNPDSRVQMTKWIEANIPAGSKIMVDAQPYSAFLPANLYPTDQLVSIGDRRSMTAENLKAQGFDYLLLTSPSYERYFLTRSADQIIRERFEEVFKNWPLIKEVSSEFGYYGFHNPILRLYKIN